jgi:hypothetical protein
MTMRVRSFAAVFALALAACGGPSGGGSSVIPSPVLPKGVPPGATVSTAYCVTIDDFAAPSAADLASLSRMRVSCVRFDLGDSPAQWASSESVLAKVNADGLKALLITPYLPNAAAASQATYNADAAEVSKLAPSLYGVELGNEFDNAGPLDEYSPTAAQDVAYQQTLATAARSANPALLISSGGTSGYDPGWLSATASAFAGVTCIGVHPYGVGASSFGSLWATIEAAYGKSACQDEWGNTPGNAVSAADLTTAIAQSNGVVPVFVYYNLANLEQNPSLAASFGSHP